MEKTYDTLSEKYSHLFIKNELYPLPMFGFECGIGWYDLLSDLLEKIDLHIKSDSDNKLSEFAVTQIKEKFGGLRFYYDGGDDHISSLVNDAEILADKTCEFCGSNENIMRSTGWIVTACKKCTENRDGLKGRVWIAKN